MWLERCGEPLPLLASAAAPVVSSVACVAVRSCRVRVSRAFVCVGGGVGVGAPPLPNPLHVCDLDVLLASVRAAVLSGERKE